MMDQFDYRLKLELIDQLVRVREIIPTNTAKKVKNLAGYGFMFPAILLVLPLAIGILLLVQLSFLTYEPFDLYSYVYTLENWQEFLSDPLFIGVLFRTFKISVFVTLTTLVIALPYTYRLIRTKSGVYRKLLIIGVLVPWFIGTVVRAFGWRIILGKNGLFNSVLTMVFGIEPIVFLGTEFAILIGQVQLLIPFAVVTMAPAVQAIDRDMERAAQNLGAGKIQTARHVIIPLSIPGITSATIVCFSLSMAAFAVPAFLGQGLVRFMGNVIFDQLLVSLNYPMTATLSLALITVTTVVILLLLSFFETRGAMSLEGGEA